jgi:hypothetical protein
VALRQRFAHQDLSSGAGGADYENLHTSPIVVPLTTEGYTAKSSGRFRSPEHSFLSPSQPL